MWDSMMASPFFDTLHRIIPGTSDPMIDLSPQHTL